jgi:hypothetical protein
VWQTRNWQTRQKTPKFANKTQKNAKKHQSAARNEQLLIKGVRQGKGGIAVNNQEGTGRMLVGTIV